MKTYVNTEEVQAGLIESIEGTTIKLKGEKEKVEESHHFMTVYGPQIGQMYVKTASHNRCMQKNAFDEMYKRCDEVCETKKATKKVVKKTKKK